MNATFKPVTFNTTTEIPVMEFFYSLQGEGYHSGKAAFFIRLAGCDVGCTWCDVKESWPVNPSQIISIDKLVNEALKYEGRFIVITGGEPSLYDLVFLTAAFKKHGFYVAIETSGTNVLKGTFDWICLSPKKFKPALQPCFKQAHELKIIVFNKHDFVWAQEQAANTSINCMLFVQPEWDKANELNPLIVNFIQNNPKWRLSLQTHKYLNIP